MGKIKVKIPISLNDLEYFCNKSWTVSYNVNTKSWVSFHSYIPNWYIGDTNLFYSGLRDCCSDFDFIAGELPSTFDCDINGYVIEDGYEIQCEIEGHVDLIPSTSTTTTTSSTSSTTTTTTSLPTTTTTTTLVPNCDMEGEAECIRPSGLINMYFITGYDDIDTTISQYTACDFIELFDIVPFPDITVNYIIAQLDSVYIGEHVYLLNGTDNCECVPDGWYFTDETKSGGYVFKVEDCKIVEYYECGTTTTTTTTDIEGTTTTTTTVGEDTTTTTTTTTESSCNLNLIIIDPVCIDGKMINVNC